MSMRSQFARKASVAVSAAIAILLLSCRAFAQEGTFAPTGSMTTGRYGHTATLLLNGKVLVAGGTTFSSDLASTELYDPTTGTFSAIGSMTTRRVGHTATLLPNGKVLVTGGCCSPIFPYVLASTELYNPTTGTFSAIGSMTTSRVGHTATLLPNGKALIAGGLTEDNIPLASAELYDPATGAFTPVGSMTTARQGPTATLLPNGKVLIAGGITHATNYTTVNSAELYEPTTGKFTLTGSMTIDRGYHTATLLPNGKVLVAGGEGAAGGGYNLSVLASAELYDPITGTFAATGSMPTVWAEHTATLLPNGKVLVAGGVNGYSVLASAALYDPAIGAFNITGSMTDVRRGHTATRLSNGKVLVTGGYNFFPARLMASAELYTSDEIPVSIDIKPGERANTINLKSRGIVQVAILSSPTFDASTVNPDTITLAGASVTTTGKGTPLTAVRDVDRDGRLDLVVQVRTEDLQLTSANTEVVLKATTFSGQRIRGTDSVRIVP